MNEFYTMDRRGYRKFWEDRAGPGGCVWVLTEDGWYEPACPHCVGLPPFVEWFASRPHPSIDPKELYTHNVTFTKVPHVT